MFIRSATIRDFSSVRGADATDDVFTPPIFSRRQPRRAAAALIIFDDIRYAQAHYATPTEQRAARSAVAADDVLRQRYYDDMFRQLPL